MGVIRLRLRALPVLGLLGVLIVVGAAGAGTTGLAAAASVDTHSEFLDAPASSFTATVHNTGSVRIGAVAVTPPSGWQVTACSTRPTGWTATKSSTGCRYTSASTTSDDIRAGSSAPFGIGLQPVASGTNAGGSLNVSVTSTNNFAIGSFVSASPEGSGLDLVAYAWEVLDAVVAKSAPQIGSACPPAQAVARPTGNVIVVCGRNASSDAQALSADHTTIGGTLLASAGTFTAGTVPPTGSSTRGVVLGSSAGATGS